MIGSIGTWILVGLAIILVVGLLAGWLAGMGRPSSERMLLGLASANRNIAAALVIAVSIGGDAVVHTLVGALTTPWCSSCWRARSASARPPRRRSQRGLQRLLLAAFVISWPRARTRMG